MIIHHSAAAGLRLDEAQDFRKFKLVLEGAGATNPVIPGIEFVDGDNVLVGIEAVPQMAGAPQDDPEWRAGYAAMLAAAAKYGWIDEAGRAIRAHVERRD